MANDIGLNPPTKELGHRRSCTVKAGETHVKFGALVQSPATGDHGDCQTTTSAGDTNLLGVCQSQGDPNNSGLFAAGDVVDVQDSKDCQVLVLGSTAYAVGDPLISSTTAGVAKKLASETGADIIGYCRQNITTGANSQLISAFLTLSRRGS